MTPSSETGHQLSIATAGLTAAVELPEDLLTSFMGLVSGPRVESAPDPDVHYRVTVDGPGRFGLERDAAGLRRVADPGAALRALVTDLAGSIARRRPGTVVARGGAVGIGGRGVVVLGAEGSGTSTLVRALVEAGASLLSDGLVVFDAHSRVHPVVLGGGEPSTAEAPAPHPSALLVATTYEPASDWAPDEVAGTRAVLGLLARVGVLQQRSPEARALIRALATQVVELRGPRPEAVDVAADLMARARSRPMPDGSGPPTAAGAGPALEVTPARTAPARVLRLDDVLDPDEHRRLLDHALAQRSELTPSSVLSDEPDTAHGDLRRSQTSFVPEDIWGLFEERLVRLVPQVRRELGIDWFELDHIERQLTVHGDGDHFISHIDNGGPEVASRVISAVYYFNREPRRFSGGELRLLDTVERNGGVEPTDTFTEVDPADNSLIFFPSETFHEVRPVHVPGDDFADRRFTLVFWVRRSTAVDDLFAGDADEVADRQRDLLPSLTDDGFRVVDTPPDAQARLRRAFDDGWASAPDEHADPAILTSGDPSYIELDGLGRETLEGLRHIHEDWYGAPLVSSAAHGLRVYREGQTMARHTDRVRTHIISSVVHVAADVDEPWPLVVEDAEGSTHDVLLEPGQMLLYEGARLPHSRPHPLRGRYYASLFLHYRSADWPFRLAKLAREAAVPAES